MMVDVRIANGKPDTARVKLLVLASHDENLIRKSCNKVVRLDRGYVVAET